MESEYLDFDKSNLPAGKLTYEVYVRAKRNHTLLGTIKWYGAWSQYCFYPESDRIFNVGCLKDIQDYIKRLMDERKT